jgi:hypothetical protein
MEMILAMAATVSFGNVTRIRGFTLTVTVSQIEITIVTI